MPLNIKRFYLSSCLPVLAFSLCTVAQPAQAGFEWTAPEQEVVTPGAPSALPEVTPMPDVMPEPVIKEEMPESGTPVEEPLVKTVDEPVMPQEIPAVEEPVEEAQPEETKGLEINPYPAAEALDDEALEAQPAGPVLLPMDSDQTLSDLSSETVEAPQEPLVKTVDEPETFEIVEGFGSDMPLALALRQIVPPHYAFSFGDGVNPGIRVSWNGGKPWNQVAEEMLAPVNMVIEIKDKTVTVKSLENQPVQEPVSLLEEDSVQEEVQAAIEPEPESAAGKMIPLPVAEEDVAMMEESLPPLDKTATPQTDEGMTVARKNIIDPGTSEAVQPMQQEIQQEVEMTPMPVVADTAPEPITEITEMSTPEPVTEIAGMSAPEPAMEDLQNAVPVPLPEKISAPDIDAMRVWEAKKGASLKDLLYQWSTESGVNLIWDTGHDYKLTSNVFISGTFENALKVLFSKAIQGGPKYSFTKEGHPELVVGR